MINSESKFNFVIVNKEWQINIVVSVIYLFLDNRAGPSNLGNVISQILLCKQITPDFNHEELCSIIKDSEEIAKILKEIGEYMPKQENNLGNLFM